MIGIYDGIEGYQKFLSRLFKYRLKLKWYAIALLVAPVTVFTSLLVLWIFSPEFLPGIFTSGDSPVASAFGLAGANKTTLVLFALMIGLFNGFVEELGWTGFVTHKQRLKHNFIATGLNIGMMWGLWHLLSNYIGSAVEAGNFPLPLYTAVLLFSFLPPFRILMTWVYAHTRSLFIAILMHASLDIFWILSMPNILTGQQRVIWYLAWDVVLWSVVSVIRIVSIRKDSSKKIVLKDNVYRK